jgi:DNA-binding NarL/FixJ family response regulator
MTATLGGWASGRAAMNRFPRAHWRGGVRPVATAVLCAEPVLAGGAKAYLRGRVEVDVGAGVADVLLVLADVLDQPLRERIDAGLAGLVAARAGAVSAGAVSAGVVPRLVLVVDEMEERHLWWAVGQGLSAVLPRSTTSWDDVVGALVTAREGGAELPSSAVGWLLDQVRALDARLAGVGVTAAGFTVRETEILRLLAAGLETADVARELNYSERTIKSAVQGVKERLGLRNRVQVVAHALRIGAI